LPKPFSEYPLREWLRLRPLIHRLKQAGYNAVDARYRRLPARVGDLAAIGAAIRGRRVMITVAFADAEAIEWQSRLVRRFAGGALYIVADNSPTDEAAKAVEAVARREGRPYIRLPHNPWTGHAPSRSHGVALNWLWSNLLRPHQPEAFGFLDDDLFPTAADDPFAPLSRQPVFGGLREAGGRWFLWAGFCFFRFAAVRDLDLDFGQDWFSGLDTGGANWWPLYQTLDLAALGLEPARRAPIVPGIPAEECCVFWCGSWLHEYGTARRADLAERKREEVARLLRPLLDEPSQGLRA
jgi:hypothetical protein